MKNRSEEWQQLCIQDKAERPEPVKPEAGRNELLKQTWRIAAALHSRQSGTAGTSENRKPVETSFLTRKTKR